MIYLNKNENVTAFSYSGDHIIQTIELGAIPIVLLEQQNISYKRLNHLSTLTSFSHDSG